MHFTTSLVLYSMLQAAATASAGCDANNCLRAVIASAFTTRHGTADCSSYFKVTVAPGTTTLTVTNAHTTTTTVEVLPETVSPTSIPAYASPCSGSVQYSSACSCLGVTHITTTVATTTPTPTSTSSSVNTSAGYIIVSPSSCPPSTPSGTVVGQSDATFSAANGGLQYQQYENSQFIIQNATSGTFFVDLSSSTSITISDTDGDTLIIYANGTFEAFAGSCEIEVVGSGLAVSSSSSGKRSALERRQSSALCSDVKSFCESEIGKFIITIVSTGVCNALGTQIGVEIGAGIGFLGNIFGPEVGLPTTLLGAFLGGKFSSYICAAATFLLSEGLCNACPDNGLCGFGTLSCNGGPCQDILSDPNNCGACGNVCSTGLCSNGACSISTCNGAACGSIQSCTGDCFCFEGSSTIGFCGENTPCDLDPPCASDEDCSLGSVCAVNTCCGSSICLAVCGGEIVKRGMRFNERTLGGTNASYPAGVAPGF